MKLTKTHRIKASKSGMTLLELTVVILVLLSLISILFIGARAWKRGSDRAASILTIRNVQQAVRAHANMSALNAGDTINPGTNATAGDVFGPGSFIESNPTEGTHPAGTSYTFAYGPATSSGTIIPDVGVLYLAVTGSDPADATVGADASYYMPEEEDVTDW